MRLAWNYVLDFEAMNKTLFFDQYRRIDSYFSGSDLASSGVRRPARSWKFSRPCAARCRPTCTPSLTQIRSTATTNRGAPISREGDPAPARGRLGNPRPEAHQCQDRRALPHRVPAQRPDLRSASCCLQAGARADRYWGERARGRPSAIREPRAQPQLRRSSSPAGGNRFRPATSSATIGARPPPTARLAQLVGIKDPAIDALIERVIFARTGRSCRRDEGTRPRAAAHNYVVPQWTRRSGLRAGTASGDPRSSREYGAPASPRSGGTTRARGQDGGARVEREPAAGWCWAPARSWRFPRLGLAPGTAHRPRPVELRRAEISGEFPELRLREPGGPPRRPLLGAAQLDPRQPVAPDLQHVEHLRAARRRGRRHEPDLRQPDGAGAGRARRALRPARPLGRDRRRPRLPLPAAAAGPVPRRLASAGAGRRLLAQAPEGEGSSRHRAGDARRGGCGGRGRRDRGGALRARPQPRPAAVRGGPAGVLRRLLRRAGVRGPRPWSRRSGRVPIRSGGWRPGASSNCSGSPITGPPSCR